MKPPCRLRSAPARYNLGSTPRVWTDREKRRLLQALRAQAQVQGPLRPELLKKYLPSRDEAEILAFVHHLKERVAREAVNEQYQYRQRKQKDAPIPAPIEVWMELAEKLTGRLENAVTAAFSQIWTIASAEPLSLLHSVPPKPVVVKNSQSSSPALHREGTKSNEESQEVAVSSNLTPAENGGFHVDFEKIYKYLSVISHGSKAPELPPGESAVLLDLLLSLPEELSFLDFKKLKSHMHKRYMELNAPYKAERNGMKEAGQPASSTEEQHNTFPHVHPATTCLPQHQEGTSAPANAKGDTESNSASDWKTLGICPLNSFLFPLDILARKEEKVDRGNGNLHCQVPVMNCVPSQHL